MTFITKNITISVVLALVNGTNVYAQENKLHLTDELILSIDPSCTFLSIDTSYPIKEYISMNSYPEVSSVIDSGTFEQIVKNYPETNTNSVSIRNSFKKIKLITPKQIDSLHIYQKASYKCAVSSLPIFDNNKQYAIIQYSKVDTRGSGFGIWLLKNTNHKWVKIGWLGGGIVCRE